METAFLVVIGSAVLGLLLAAIYAVAVRNDLSRRWARLMALAANVRAVRQRRQGVGRDVGRYVRRAQDNEQSVSRFGSQRGRRRGGRLIDISDTANGWPMVATTPITSQGMNVDVSSRDSETAARVALHSEAAQYNQILMAWPSCFVAQACGFRPWKYRPHGRLRRR